MFSNSAQAMFRRGIRVLLPLPNGMYSTKLRFPKSFFLKPVNCTFMITAPSLKCKFTFLPKKDLALFKPKLSIDYSPVQLFVCNIIPTLFADWECFTPKQDVKFYVFAAAFSVPRILAMLHFGMLQRLTSNSFTFVLSELIAFNTRCEQNV
jgi:hypothetical protein